MFLQLVKQAILPRVHGLALKTTVAAVSIHLQVFGLFILVGCHFFLYSPPPKKKKKKKRIFFCNRLVHGHFWKAFLYKPFVYPCDCEHERTVVTWFT